MNTVSEVLTITAKASPRAWIPIYHRRFFLAKHYLRSVLPAQAAILDVGCGEGAFMEQLREVGFDHVSGIDPFAPLSDTQISRGSIYELPTDSESQDAVTCLDVMEHLPLNRQWDAASELYRICKPGGITIVTVPNMAHLHSRWQFLRHGRPWRNSLAKHPGELTIHERLDVLTSAGFQFLGSAGFHLTLSKDPCPSGPFGKLASRLMFHPRCPVGLCAEVMLVLARPPISAILQRLETTNALRKIAGNFVPSADDPTAAALG